MSDNYTPFDEEVQRRLRELGILDANEFLMDGKGILRKETLETKYADREWYAALMAAQDHHVPDTLENLDTPVREFATTFQLNLPLGF